MGESLQRELQQKYFYEEEEFSDMEEANNGFVVKPYYKGSISKKHNNSVNSTINSMNSLNVSHRNLFSPQKLEHKPSISLISDSMHGDQCILHQMNKPKVHKAMTIMNAMSINNNIRYTQKKQKNKKKTKMEIVDLRRKS